MAIKKKSRAPKSAMAKIRESFNQTAGSSDNRWLKIAEPTRGESYTRTRLRILPPWNKTTADGFFYFTAALHYGFSIGGRNRAITCPEASGKGKCPVCEFISRLKRSDSEDHAKLALRIRQNRRYWVNCIDRAHEDEGIKIYGGNKKFIEHILDSSENAGDITDINRGRDIFIKRTGKGFNTRYSYSTDLKRSSVDVDLKDLHQLDKDVVEWMTLEQMVQALQENFKEELVEVGMSFKKKSTKKATPKKGKKMKKRIDEDDDIDLDDEEYEDDDVDIDDEDFEDEDMDDEEDYDEDEEEDD